MRSFQPFGSRNVRQLLAAVVLCATTAARIGAQNPPARDTSHLPAYRARLLGLFDQATGQPIAGADVFDVSTGWSAQTTATGTVSLIFLPDGGGLVRIRKVGYAPLFTKVSISPRDTAPITLLLERVTELPAVVTRDSLHPFVSGNLNGFQERARLKMAGYFITDTLLRNSENRTTANLLRSQFPGIGAHLREGPFSAASFDGCVFLDGVPVNSPGPAARGIPPFNLNSAQISDLQGIEYYPRAGTAPAELTGGCGGPLLMLWTRER